LKQKFLLSPGPQQKNHFYWERLDWMDKRCQLLTAGSWQLKPGKEADFIKAWEELAHWTARRQPGAREDFLL
jgi:hypothetical protein